MHAIQNTLPADDFTPPSADAINGVTATVPDVGGMSISAAQDTLEAAGFKTVLGDVRGSGYPAGTVAYTYPSRGSSVSNATVITIYESSGTPPRRSNNGRGNGGRRGGR